VPDWLPSLLLLGGGGVVGYVGHWLKARTPTKDNDRTLADNERTRADARRKEALGTFRWAAELAVSGDEAKKRLGVDMMWSLVDSNSDLTFEDLRMIRTAVRSALGPKLQAIGEDPEAEVRLQLPREEETP
jgi:hypothetical protein